MANDAGIPVSGEQYVRLECVRLVHRHDKDDATVLARAEAMAQWVMNGSGKPAAKAAQVRQGKANAPD